MNTLCARGIIIFFLCLLTLLKHQSSAYTYTCLDDCECDTDDSAIHCHAGERDRLQMPKTKLRGFDVVGLTRNNIKVLPSEDLLLEKFPDLKAVDVEGNADFDCSTLDQYSRITVISDCGKTPEELEKERAKLPTTAEPNDECDVGCQADRRAKELHQYIVRLWEVIKEKLREVSKKHGLDKFVEDVQKFFSEDVGPFFNDMGKKISNL